MYYILFAINNNLAIRIFRVYQYLADDDKNDDLPN